jgi:hypothetical protein
VFGLCIANDRTQEASDRRTIAADRRHSDSGRVGRRPQLLQPIVLECGQAIVGPQRVLDEAVVGCPFDGATHLGADDGDANHADEEDEQDEGQYDTPPE